MRVLKIKPIHRRKLGEAIRNRRRKLSLSQEELAEKANCHRNFIGYLERSEKSMTIDTLVRLARALNCRVADLVNDAQI